MNEAERFNRLAQLAAALFQVVACSIRRIEHANGSGAGDAVVGLPVTKSPEADVFRRATMLADHPVIVSDLREDHRFQRSLLVTGAPAIRFYAGIPLRTSSGLIWGTLELFDDRVRTLTAHERSLLVGFGRWAEAEMELLDFGRRLGGADHERKVADEKARDLEEELAERDVQFRQAAGEVVEIGRRLRETVDGLGEAVARLSLHAEFSAALTRDKADSNEIPDLLVRRLADVIGDLSVALLRSADGVWIDPIAVHHRDPATADMIRALLTNERAHRDEGAAAAVMATGVAVYLPFVSAESLEFAGPDERLLIETVGLSSLLVVPLRLDGRIVGAVYVARADPSRGPLTRSDLQLAQDLTERAGEVMHNIAIRAALEESERRFRRLVDNAPDVVYRARLPEFTLEYISPITETILGYSSEDFYSHPGLGLQIVHPDDRPILTSILAEPRRIPPAPILMRWVRADGDILWMEHRVAPVVDDDGQVLALEGIARDVTALKRAQDELVHQTLHDGLTGLPNRELFNELLSASLRRLARRRASTAVLYLDLDRFKVINDSLGHHVGDALLIAIADRLRALVRPTDTIARLGGDEFAVIVEDPDDRQLAGHLAERIRIEFEAPFTIDGHEVFTTTSIGIAMTDDPSTEPTDLLRHADVAMYQAKAGGGNSFELFDERLRGTIQRRLAEENALRQAIDRGELRVLYQPITEIDSGEIVAVEALARWQRGAALAGAETFIGLAEDTGLIVPIGAWVLEQAYRDTARINLGRDRDLRVHVNVSARQLVSDLLTTVAEDIAARSQDTGTSLCLEITESTLMAKPIEAIAILQHLHALGIQFAIDDFGTGHSSLSYLRQLPVDVLKIDRSFIDGIDDDPAAASIVTAIIALAHNLDLQVTAEGVETPGQLAKLKSLHCEEAQGFLLGEPVTASELEELLTA